MSPGDIAIVGFVLAGVGATYLVFRGLWALIREEIRYHRAQREAGDS